MNTKKVKNFTQKKSREIILIKVRTPKKAVAIT